MQNSAVFHRSQHKLYETAFAASGVYIINADGRRTIDGSSGAAVSCLGHGHTEVIDAIVRQARQLSFVHGSFFTNHPAQDLAKLLIEQSSGAFKRAMLLNSGSEAVESAIKLARQYHVANSQPERVNFISRQYSYHGNTLGALSAGMHFARRSQFAPLLSPSFHHVSRCFYSKDARAGETEEKYTTRLIEGYEAMFQQLGPSTVAAVILEPVSGATLGSVPATKGYLRGVRDVCDRHGALLIFDEVMCGMGRCGTFNAWQSLGGVAPDLQTIGKGLAGGYQPISGVLLNGKVFDMIESPRTPSVFLSGHTYQDHPMGCAAALATQRVIIRDKLLDKVRVAGRMLRQRLQESVPNISEVRGLGLFLTVEFEQTSETPIAADVASACLKNGAAVYLCSDATDAVMFAPPFIIADSEIDELVDVFRTSVEEVLSRRAAHHSMSEKTVESSNQSDYVARL